jgi:3-dehydroquinate dehydratase
MNYWGKMRWDSMENIKNIIVNKCNEIKDKDDEKTHNDLNIFIEDMLNKFKERQEVVLLFLEEYFDIEYQISEDEIIECVICYSNKTNNILNCNHKFCSDCINKWIEHNNSCPMCRSSIKNIKAY